MASETWEVGSAGVLLDFRADSEGDSLGLLASAAAAALSDRAGCAVDCAVSLVRPRQTPLTAGTCEPATALARWDQGSGGGPVSQALAGRLAVLLNDFSRDPRWPAYWAPLRDAGYRSVVAVPLQVEPGCTAALTLFTHKTNVFAPAVLADVVMFSKLAARSYAMASAVRAALAAAAHLRTAMEGRTSIDVACGVIMGQNRCSYEEAFGIIAKASSNRNVKVRALAESLLEDLPGGAPPTHFRT
jgi:GAF domain-containing protein